MKKLEIDTKEFAQLLKQLGENIATDFSAAIAKEEFGIVGIHTRGAILARRLSDAIQKRSGVQIPMGSLDITLYRDDVSEIANQPLVRETDIAFPIDGKSILLVDDVLYTGRTIRSALDALLELGRPKVVRLVVLVDRDGRELPIQADYFCHKMSVKKSERVQIGMKESDDSDGIWVISNKKIS